MVREKDLTAPYIFNKDKWIGFDDEISIKLKVLRNSPISKEIRCLRFSS